MKSLEKALTGVKTPIYVVDERLLVRNLERLKYVQEETDCRILLALKGFSMFSVFPLVGEYLTGITASSLFEARLGYEEMGKEVHIYAPAYRPEEFEEILSYCDHVVFNSPSQYRQFRDDIRKRNLEGSRIECGLRINPEYSEIETAIYDPCYRGSRLGTTLDQLTEEDLLGLDGLHFHTMCEQNADTLERTWAVVEEKFGSYLEGMKSINFGGGHHITRQDYQMETLLRVIRQAKEKYGIEVYLEPGEAIALDTGFLAARVLDIVHNGMDIAILDTSAACHMPDVLEMPYRPQIIGSGEVGVKAHDYRLGGMTCLAGDVIGDYSFDHALVPGELLFFTDMAHYTMVKNNTFNGVNLPSIGLLDDSGLRLIREFSYEDFKGRLS
jgi:carboxynorspermidine decarboxylase